MDYIDGIFQRIDLRQIRSFLLHGAEDLDADDGSHAERLKAGCDPIYRRLESLCAGGASLEEATADLSRALAAWEENYLEIGIKVGARLAAQLFR